MFKRIKTYFIQGALDTTDDIFERAQIEATYNLNFGFTILYSLMLIHFTTLETNLEFDLVNYLSWIWTASVIFTIRWTKSHFWPGLSFVVMGMCVSTCMIFLAQGTPTAELGVWHSFGIISAFCLLRRAWAYAISIYYILITTYVIIDHAAEVGFFDIGLSMGIDVGKDPVALVIPMTASLYMLGYFLQTRIKAQKVIDDQKEEAVLQQIQLQEKNHEITSSITYAKRIQEAILPRRKTIIEILPKSFVLFKPKDIVAGDFYWLEKSNGKIVFAAADCTGHGVPGAMVSVVCHNALNRAVREFRLDKPWSILDKTQKLVTETFAESEGSVKDGMDIALVSIDKAARQVEFSGAHNSLYHVRKGELTEIKADKQPIGIYANHQPFSKNTVEVESGDMIYMFSDGFPDQFGGPKGKKFKYKQLKALLTQHASEPVVRQKELLEEAFDEWRGNLEQVDDVCVIGVRI